MDRFTGAAVLDRDHARRARGRRGGWGEPLGLAFDARRAHPFLDQPRNVHARPVHADGDVLARFQVRVDEVGRRWRCSRDYAEGSRTRSRRGGGTGSFGRSGCDRGGHRRGLARGRRAPGRTRGAGRLARVKVVDPSFLNWPALPVSLADTIVPDFPLANKSFNLSYAGNDL